MKRDELKGIIRSSRTNYPKCAEFIGISISTFTKKINKGMFTVHEADKLSIFLNIKNPIEIFFDEYSSFKEELNIK